MEQPGAQLTKEYSITNTDRSVGGRISGSIASQWGNKGFASAGGDLELRFKGSAGQTFGAFNLPGVSLHLEGEANDYVGKGLNGGQIVIVPHRYRIYDIYTSCTSHIYAHLKTYEVNVLRSKFSSHPPRLSFFYIICTCTENFIFFHFFSSFFSSFSPPPLLSSVMMEQK